MLKDFVINFNWFDIILLIVLTRICYNAVKSGIIAEFFKLIGIASAIFFALHYYSSLSAFIGKAFGSGPAPAEFIDFLSCSFIAAFFYLLLAVLRKTFFGLFKIEAPEGLNKWGGFLLGAVRAPLSCFLVIYLFAVSSVNYLKDSVATSYLGSKYYNSAGQFYAWLWNGLGSKLMSNENFNKAVTEIERVLKKEMK